jgi:polysaccharide export outer membrane protein
MMTVSALSGQSDAVGFSERTSRYLLQPNDVISVRYRYTPEFNESVTVQPDGFATLHLVGVVRLAGRAIDDIEKEIVQKAATKLNEPEISVTLLEFERPYFVVGGQVNRPGRYDLPGEISALQAITMAGGFNQKSKHSQVVLLRRVKEDLYRTRLLDMKTILNNELAAEDPRLRSGDMLLVPTNRLTKVERIVRLANFGVFWHLGER